MQRTSPVFIVGDARSGTSILLRTLLKHPSFAPRRLDLTESFAVEALLNRKRPSDDPTGTLRGFYLGDAEAYEAFRSKVRRLEALRTISWPVLGRVAARPIAWRALGSPQLLRAYFEGAARARGVTRLVEKTPHNVAFAPRLHATFPGCQQLFVVRHPVDVLGSYWRRLASEPGATWADLSVEQLCTRWSLAVHAATRHAERWPAAFLILRYESFTTTPATTFASICAFLDEPDAPDAIAGAADGYGAWEIDPHLFGDIVAETKKWRDHVDERSAAGVEDRLHEEMLAMGYERYT